MKYIILFKKEVISVITRSPPDSPSNLHNIKLETVVISEIKFYYTHINISWREYTYTKYS
jgi:hypothetical protein